MIGGWVATRLAHTAQSRNAQYAAFLTQALINRSLVALFLAFSFVLLYAQRSAHIAWARYQHETGTSRARLLLVGEPSERMAELVRAATAAPRSAQLHRVSQAERIAALSGRRVALRRSAQRPAPLAA